jgi:hypothetical protein
MATSCEIDGREVAARLANQSRLRELATQAHITVFCAHDPDELERLSS